MGALTGRWTIVETDAGIGLHQDASTRQSVLDIDEDETEVTERRHVDWGSGRVWVLIPDSAGGGDDGARKALILLRDGPHWATFVRKDVDARTPQIEIRVTSIQPDGERADRDTGSARGRN